MPTAPTPTAAPPSRRLLGPGVLLGSGVTRRHGGSGVTSTQGAGVVERTGLPRCRPSPHAAPRLCGKREQGFPKVSKDSPPTANQPVGGTQCNRSHLGRGLPWAPEGLGWRGLVPRGGHPSEGLQAGARILTPPGKSPKQGLYKQPVFSHLHRLVLLHPHLHDGGGRGGPRVTPSPVWLGAPRAEIPHPCPLGWC